MKFQVLTFIFREFCNISESKVMRVLNVAEKNDAAKNISSLLSGGSSTRREGLSVYNKIYEFDYRVLGRQAKMKMTSVSGHLMNYEFSSRYRNWNSCSPAELFDAPIVKTCTEDMVKIKNTLEREARSSDILIIWTDCDREGENIGYEIIDTCLNVNRRLDVYRAKFSEITGPSIKRAINNLGRPNENISKAVDVRQQLDLRIGASFTRFQTLRLQRVFPVLAENLLSYGSCQFPTLGFVVERYLEREKFIPQDFWKIKVTHTIDDLTVEFRWLRDRLFDKNICEALLDRCLEKPLATVEKVDGKPKNKWRPTPLDTTEMEKIASRKLRINAKQALKIAEKLYTQGFISYPRTETNIFPDSINLRSLVELQTEDQRWGDFAQGVLTDGPNPRQGKKSDQSHPPIHPIKYTNTLRDDEAKLYEFIVRHFLACVSKDAKAHETQVTIDINAEKFTASGLIILERNYLDVYPYDNWNSKAIHCYQVGQTFEPTTLDMVEGQTTAPNLLTEADLISLMEKHGIGTDATHAEHIETIKTRFYVALENNIYFVPSAIGMGLVEGYDSMGFTMSKPNLRAELEADLKRICDGVKNPEEVLRIQIDKYRELFRIASEQVNKIDAAVGKYIQENAVELNPSNDPLNNVATELNKVMPCRICNQDMVLRITDNKKFLSCTGDPNCKAVIWLPAKVISVSVSIHTCVACGPNVKMLDFKFKPNSMSPFYPQNYRGCINGCDRDFIEMLDVRLPRPTDTNRINNNHNVQNQSNNQGTTGRSWHNLSESSDSSSNIAGTNRYQRQKRPRSDNDSESVTENRRCYCNLPAKQLTVKKDGPNKGRIFYACPKGMNEQRCDFFQWDDDTSERTNTHVARNMPSTSARPSTSSRGSYRGGQNRQGGSRKCGQCHQPGHNRRNCPQNEDSF